MLPCSFSEERATEKYMAQLQHNIWVVASRTAVLSVITGGGKWVSRAIPLPPSLERNGNGTDRMSEWNRDHARNESGRRGRHFGISRRVDGVNSGGLDRPTFQGSPLGWNGGQAAPIILPRGATPGSAARPSDASGAAAVLSKSVMRRLFTEPAT
jgi:hypothetical protein